MPVGNIELFDPVTSNWKLYTERLEQYFLINDTKEYLKVPTLIALMGATSYELLVALCAPQIPSTLSYKDIVMIMSNHLYPKLCILAERYKFRQRKQNNRETILDYASDLKKLAMKCEYKTTLDENLRDQLICGIQSEATRKRIFAEDTLDFRTALAIAHSSETGEGTNGDCNIDNEVQMSISEFKDPFAITFKIEPSEETNTKYNCDDEIPLCDFKTDLVVTHCLETSAETNIDSNNYCELEISPCDSKNDWPIEASGKPSSKFYDEDEVPMSSTEKFGSEDGMPKKKQKTNKRWLYVKKFINLKKAEEFLESEKSWGRYWMRFTKEGMKRYYRCKKVKRRGPQCAAERYLLLDKYSDDIFLYRTDADHNHDEIGNRADLGIADLTKVMINNLVDQRLKPNAILKSLREMEGIKVPAKSKLTYYLSRLRRSKIKNGPLSK